MSPVVALFIGVLLLVYWRVTLAVAAAVVIALIILGVLSVLKAGHGSLHVAAGVVGHHVGILARIT